MTKIVLKFLLLLFVPFFAQARDTDSLRVLWVGNSYTYYNDMPSTVRQIAATQKVKLSCTRFLKGGERLSGHLKNQKLLDAIAAGGWDYVILQEFRAGHADPAGRAGSLPCGAYARQPGARRVARCPCDLLHDVGA